MKTLGRVVRVMMRYISKFGLITAVILVSSTVLLTGIFLIKSAIQKSLQPQQHTPSPQPPHKAPSFLHRSPHDITTPQITPPSLSPKAIKPCPIFPQKSVNKDTVWGTVCDFSGASVQRARITLFTPNFSFFRETRSDKQGIYRFNDVPNGTYQLAASALNYEYEETKITLSGIPIVKSFSLGPELNQGKWSIIADTEPENFQGTGTSTLLSNGEIFFCHDSKDPVIINPVTSSKRFPRNSEDFGGKEAAGHATALLMNGDVFLAGGGNGIGGGPQGNTLSMKGAKIYNPNNDTWTILPDMNVGRWYPSIVRLPDSRLMVMGGDNGKGRTNTVEIYDPNKNSWTMAASYKRVQEMPPGLVLYTGEVLKTWRDVEIYNIQSNRWRNAAQMLQARSGTPSGQHSDHTYAMLPDGRVAVFGIDPTPDNLNPRFTEIYDPIKNAWSFGSSPTRNSRALVRQRPETQMLPGGKILVYGGEYTGVGQSSVPLSRAGNVQAVTKVTDLYDPKTDTWRPLADMSRFIHYHSIGALLPDGRIINTNGAGVDGTPFGRDTSIEAFEPPYLFRGPRPNIDSLSTTTFSVGEAFSMQVSRTSGVTEVVLIGMRAETHWIDSGPNRYLSLDFVLDGSKIQASIPNDRMKALPGWYLLFAMVDDIPSVGKIVRIQ